MDIDNTKRSCLKIFLNYAIKYKCILFALILVPCILSVACYFSIPYFNVAGSSAWLSFWGGYLGSVIMAGVTLFVLHKQLKQNQDENESNRKLSELIRTQELEFKWFEDLKASCSTLCAAFNNEDVVLVSDLDPLSDGFNQRVVQLLSQMNEAEFNFLLVVNYHRNIENIDEVKNIQNFVKEYISLLSDMNSLHIYGSVLNALNSGDYQQEEIKAKLMRFIHNHKKNMDVPEVTTNRVWDLILNSRFNDINCIEDVLNILRKRIENFYMPNVCKSITALIKEEYKRITDIVKHGTK